MNPGCLIRTQGYQKFSTLRIPSNILKQEFTRVLDAKDILNFYILKQEYFCIISTLEIFTQPEQERNDH
jgi:hypothetical protein